MGFAMVIEWLGFETGLFWGEKNIRWKIVKGEIVILTIGIKIEWGFGRKEDAI
jgi:hypothetical protein